MNAQKYVHKYVKKYVQEYAGMFIWLCPGSMYLPPAWNVQPMAPVAQPIQPFPELNDTQHTSVDLPGPNKEVLRIVRLYASVRELCSGMNYVLV